MMMTEHPSTYCSVQVKTLTSQPFLQTGIFPSSNFHSYASAVHKTSLVMNTAHTRPPTTEKHHINSHWLLHLFLILHTDSEHPTHHFSHTKSPSSLPIKSPP
mmetsp:Transcript_50002/g.106353  ORF Transcript_50002/g.106353 Transcript_50002/m.106353 type:complete len:102 (-) Transcript_50002:1786-2091(-)